MNQPDESSAIVVDVLPASCPKCGSTERADKYSNTVTREIRGTLAGGRQYTHVTHRRTRCVCGQIRVERTYENRPPRKMNAPRKKSRRKREANPDSVAKPEGPSAYSGDEPVAVPVEV